MNIKNRILININEDETVCECVILPAQSGNPEITFPEIIETLNAKGVLYGLEETVILENLLMAGNNPEKVSFVAARAIPPQNGETGALNIHLPFPFECRAPSGLSLSGARIPAGSLLLSVNNENLDGIDGTSVTGRPLPSTRGTPLKIQAGKNVKIVQQGSTAFYYASMDGMAVFENNALIHVRPVSDGWFNVFITDNDIRLTLALYAPSGGGRFVESGEIIRFLESQSVPIGGLQRLEIERLIARQAAESADIENYLLLEGIPPENGRDSSLEFKVAIEPIRLFAEEHKTTKATNSGKINFHSVLSINAVKKDQLIAEKIPATPAVRNGRDIFGRVVPASSGEDHIRFRPGKNIHSPDGINFYASINGQVKKTGDLFWISPVFSVSGDLDFSVGNISFTGDVLIGGGVPDNFQVKTDETVIIGRNVGAADIYAGRDLVVCGGILNKKKSRIIVQGNLHARFIENSGRIEVNGDVFVSDYILQSEVRANGRILLSGNGKGQVIGGELWAGTGVSARVTGNESEVVTRIYAGSFVFVRHALKVVEKEIREIQNKIRKEAAIRGDAFSRLTYQLEQLQKWRSGLLDQLSKGKTCQIRVEKEIYPKTEFMLHDRKITFKNQDSFKNFVYDPDQETVITGHFT